MLQKVFKPKQLFRGGSNEGAKMKLPGTNEGHVTTWHHKVPGTFSTFSRSLETFEVYSNKIGVLKILSQEIHNYE